MELTGLETSTTEMAGDVVVSEEVVEVEAAEEEVTLAAEDSVLSSKLEVQLKVLIRGLNTSLNNNKCRKEPDKVKIGELLLEHTTARTGNLKNRKTMGLINPSVVKVKTLGDKRNLSFIDQN